MQMCQVQVQVKNRAKIWMEMVYEWCLALFIVCASQEGAAHASRVIRLHAQGNVGVYLPWDQRRPNPRLWQSQPQGPVYLLRPRRHLSPWDLLRPSPNHT